MHWEAVELCLGVLAVLWLRVWAPAPRSSAGCWRGLTFSIWARLQTISSPSTTSLIGCGATPQLQAACFSTTAACLLGDQDQGCAQPWASKTFCPADRLTPFAGSARNWYREKNAGQPRVEWFRTYQALERNTSSSPWPDAHRTSSSRHVPTSPRAISL